MDQLGRNGFFQNTCIDFSANVNFLELPASVMQAARSGLIASMQSPPGEQARLEDCVAAWEDVAPDQICCGNGPSEMASALMQVLKPQKALIPAPGLEEYMRALSMAKCAVEYYHTKESEDFCIHTEDFCSQITEDTDIVFLCNPNNPTAVLHERASIEKILKHCEAVHALLFLDESLLELTEAAASFTMKSKTMSSALLILKDFTKIFAMPGIRLSYGICGDKQLADRLRQAKQPGVSMVARRAGVACTKERDFVHKTIREIAKERTWLMQQLKELGMERVRGEANIIFFASRPKLHVFSILHGIMLRDCSNYEGLGEGWYRIAVRSHEENEKLLGVIKEWQSQKA